LRRSSFPADEAAIRHLYGRSQPSFEVKQHPRAVRVLAHRPHLLAPVYGWFTEGFETRDLKETKALLDELS